jgi:hypothetical protein
VLRRSEAQDKRQCVTGKRNKLSDKHNTVHLRALISKQRGKTMLTDTEIRTEGLTKEDVSYLRRADDVYCVNRDGVNYIGAVKRRDFNDQFSDDKRIEIPVMGNGASGNFTSAWSFPWHTLRAGDMISFYWYPDANTNELLREVNLHADVLYIDIRRGKKSVRYIVSVSVCADNSARMCKSS